VQKELGPVCLVSPDKARFIRFAKAGEISAKGLKTGILGGGNERAKVGQGQGK
jgi:hypothetical protein